MYIANNMVLGFWVKRKTWSDLCARVTFVGELDRRAHCYGLPSVRADLFSFSTRQLQEADSELALAWSPKTWRKIPPPPSQAWNDGKKRLSWAGP